MKHLLATILIILICHQAQAQQYIPMPADSATWRYRVIDLDDTNYLVIDLVLVVSNQDTLINGNSYHIIFNRTHNQTVGISSYPPPVVDDTCFFPDAYFSAMRESGKKWYEWTGTTEKLMYDFNALPGSQVPGPGIGTVTVTATDSVSLGGVWHKRYSTSDASYYIIEGVGSSIGLLPSYYGVGYIFFHCFRNPQFQFSPAGAPNCTTVYPHITTGLAVANEPVNIKVYPIPFSDELHIESSANASCALYNMAGTQLLPSAAIIGWGSINTAALPAGIYYIQLRDERGVVIKTQKVIKM